MVELGISTFGEITELEGTGQTYSHAERIRQLVAEIELADKVDLDVYGTIGRILQYQLQRLFWPLGQSIPRKSV
ncbi:flavin monoxygenase [Streptococcus pneumoniae]|nr:flavin monoxygenase [Streptococcus pneumoniae]